MIHLDHNDGDGSLNKFEAMRDDEGLYLEDGRSKMETSFDRFHSGGVLMSDGKRRPWWYLHDWHEGREDDDYGERRRKANVRRDAATFCNQVDCSPHQQRRVIFHVDNMDVNSFGQTSSEAVILSLIAYVCNVDQRWIQRETDFRELLESLEIPMDKVKKTTRSVQEKVE